MLNTSMARLHRIENCNNVGRVNLSFVKKAAKVYDTTSDYLIGLTDDFDGQDPESRWFGREIGNGAKQFYCNEIAKLIVESDRMQRQVEAALTETAAIHAELEELTTALDRFIELNADKINEFPASAKLKYRAGLLKERLAAARFKLTRAKVLLAAQVA